MQGLIFDIHHFSTQDGPGIRTTVFLKGCPLSCPWCHNPEGIRDTPETMTRTYHLGKSSEVRQETVGQTMDVSAVLEEVKKSSVFFEESGGGVTFSGGEPLMQADFLYECMQACREAGIHTVLDTCGYCPPDIFKKILQVTDLILFDLKHSDEGVHRSVTGVSLAPILKNLELAASLKPVILRIPVIPSINDSLPIHQQIADFLQQSVRVSQIDLLPYHAYAESKYRRLNREYPLRDLPVIGQERMNQLKEIYTAKGYFVTIGG